MNTRTNRDPWVQVRTLNGFQADELISALQKEIRRGNVENAVIIAYEMFITSPELEAYLWKRLMVISVEDIGWGDLQAPVLVHTLYQMHSLYGRQEGDRLLYAIHAVRYLCACQKDRSTDEMLNWVKHSIETGALLPSVPDYALDMHTARGQEMGRGLRHFWEEGAIVQPELPGRESTYRLRILEVIDDIEPEEKN